MSDGRLTFEEGVMVGEKRQKQGLKIALGFMTALAIAQATALVGMMPLKRTEVFSVLVDRTTGQAEKIVQVQPVGIEQEQALQESLLVAYVSDRESFIQAGIQERLESIVRRTSGSARDVFVKLWTKSATNTDYPPTVYGKGARVDIKILSISFLKKNVAQVRFKKTLTLPNAAPIERSFQAIVEYEFLPKVERRLELVWENPLGFMVTDYAVSAETLEAQ